LGAQAQIKRTSRQKLKIIFRNNKTAARIIAAVFLDFVGIEKVSMSRRPPIMLHSKFTHRNTHEDRGRELVLMARTINTTGPGMSENISHPTRRIQGRLLPGAIGRETDSFIFSMDAIQEKEKG